MKLSAPSKLFFLISVILFALGLIGKFVVLPVITANLFWVLIAAYVVIALGCLLTGV